MLINTLIPCNSALKILTIHHPMLEGKLHKKGQQSSPLQPIIEYLENKFTNVANFRAWKRKMHINMQPLDVRQRETQ
jgi:hypothetical protein